MFCDLCSLYDLNLFKIELVKSVKSFFLNGLVSVGGGNHSFRSEIKNQIWITPSGYPRSHLKDDDLILIDLEGNTIVGNLRPTIEVPFHTEIYKNRNDINAICHVHNPYTTGFYLTAKLESTKYQGIYYLKELPSIKLPKPIEDSIIIEYKQLGSKALGKTVGIASKMELIPPSNSISEPQSNPDIIILLNHGIIGMGECIHEAKFLVELYEEWAKCLLIKKVL
ncbi:MAG TPA: class II aldolase/adducin family protein [Nitrososphaeraceae archaeon]|nr:class II aldolase/adducin family protein [Nitrososphaeraceae archaeon]